MKRLLVFLLFFIFAPPQIVFAETVSDSYNILTQSPNEKEVDRGSWRNFYVHITKAENGATITNIEVMFDYIAYGEVQNYVSVFFNKTSPPKTSPSDPQGIVLVEQGTLDEGKPGTYGYKSVSNWNGQPVNDRYYFSFLLASDSPFTTTIKKIYVRVTYSVDNRPSFDSESLASTVEMPNRINFSGTAQDDKGLQTITMKVSGPKGNDILAFSDSISATKIDLSNYYFDSNKSYAGLKGSYTVTLLLIDTANQTASKSFNVTVTEADNQFLNYSNGFVFPVLGDKSSVSPEKNIVDPLTDGWDGHGVGWSGSIGSGHLGQDYYKKSGCEGTDDHTAGQPVYAVSNGIVVQAVNSNTQYGWNDSSDHGWGRVLVIKHTLPAGSTGFNTKDTMLTSQPNINSPHIIYSLYGHLKKDSILVTVGKQVSRGQKIAEIGKGGTDVKKWTCSHLHFELKNEVAYDNKEYFSENNIFAFCCTGQPIHGIGFGYSGTDKSAPNRYTPFKFIQSNAGSTASVVTTTTSVPKTTTTVATTTTSVPKTTTTVATTTTSVPTTTTSVATTTTSVPTTTTSVAPTTMSVPTTTTIPSAITQTGPVVDIDKNGIVDATDGILLLRKLNGASSIETGVVLPVWQSNTAVVNTINAIGSKLDVDQSGIVDATDGVLILRKLNGASTLDTGLVLPTGQTNSTVSTAIDAISKQ